MPKTTEDLRASVLVPRTVREAALLYASPGGSRDGHLSQTTIDNDWPDEAKATIEELLDTVARERVGVRRAQAVARALLDLDEECLATVYNLERGNEAPLDAAVFALRDGRD